MFPQAQVHDREVEWVLACSFAHSACAEGSNDLVRAKARAGGEGQPP